MSIFQYVRENVTARQAAEFYGIEVKGKMCKCPFHEDHHPSMIIGEYFKCFSCHAGGDAVEFVRRYFNLSPRAAAEKIMADFGLVNEANVYADMKQAVKPIQNERRWILDAADTLFEYRDLLRSWKEQYAPVDREAPYPDKFVEAVRRLEKVELMIEMATSTDHDEHKAFYNNCQYEIEEIRQRLKDVKGAAFSCTEKGKTDGQN